MPDCLRRSLLYLLLALMAAWGCGSRQPLSDSPIPVPTTIDSATTAADKSVVRGDLLPAEEIAAVRATVENCGGSLRCDDEGVPVEIDLAAGRGSATPEALDAALACRGLRRLRLRAAQIPAEQLAKIQTLTRLEELMLQDAALNDAILAEVAQSLSGLRRLTIRNALEITDDGVAGMVVLKELTQLTLIEMQITGKALHSIVELPALTSLDLRMCNAVTSADLSVLAQRPDLRELKLGGYGIDDETLNIVAQLPGLVSLTVEDAAIGSRGMDQLASSPASERLETLVFARCAGLSDEALGALASLKNLRRLTLRDVPVTGTFLQKLSSLGQLELLSLNQTFLSDEAFDAIASCGRLQRLELAQNFLTPSALGKIAQLSNLEYLNMTDCGLDDAALQPLEGLNKLQTLVVDGNPGISSETVDALLGR